MSNENSGTVHTCPKCKGSRYSRDGERCTMCGSAGKVEDGGRSIAYGDTEMQETPYFGKSGYRVVVNMEPPPAPTTEAP